MRLLPKKKKKTFFRLPRYSAGPCRFMHRPRGGGAPPAQAGVVEPSRLVNIRVEMQAVTIPETVALSLLPDLKDPKKIESANAKIQEMLAKGTATLVGWPTLTTANKERAVVEGIDEIRYATEYDQPTVGFSSNFDPEAQAKIEPKVTVTQLDGVPSAFETRERRGRAGSGSRGGSERQNDQHQPRCAARALEGFQESDDREAKDGIERGRRAAAIRYQEGHTSLMLKDGERMLLGVFRTDDPPMHLELFLLKVDVIPVD